MTTMQGMQGPGNGDVAADKSDAARSIDDNPSDGQVIMHAGKSFKTIKEGLAYILVPESAKTSVDPKKKDSGDAQSVFYNPIQQFNRDLSVLAIRAYCDDLTFQREQKQDKASRGKKRKRGNGKGAKTEPTTDIGEEATNGHLAALEHSKRDLNLAAEFLAEDQAPLEPEEPDGDVSMTSTTTNVEAEDGNVKLQIGQASGQEQPPRRKERLKILDALSATGLRALRYAQEIPQVTSVTANDLSKAATESIRTNVKYNKLDAKIEVVTGNAMSHMYSLLSSPLEWSKPTKYDVIDLDPYGTAVPFLDSAMQAISDGGLLCVTCTDASLWASCGYSEKTYALYGGTPIKGLHSHEGGLRLILHAISTSAARYGISVEPLLSLSIDFYARVFVRVSQSPAEVKMLAGKTILVYNCDSGCGAWSTQALLRNQKTSTNNGQDTYKFGLAQGPTSSTFCEHCGTKTHISGPMYAGPIHNAAFVQSILDQLPTLDKSTYQTTERLEGMLTTAMEEVMLDNASGVASKEAQDATKHGRPVPKVDSTWIDRNPFYFIPSMLSKVLHARAPSEAEMRGALMHAGYSVTRSHARPGSIKTNASWTFIWHMMREWVKQKAPVKEDAIKEGTPGYGIMHGAEARRRKATSGRPLDTSSNGQAATNGDDPIPDKSSTNDDEGQTSLKNIVFDEALGKEPNKRRLKRYQENPRANWGPMNRAKR